MIRTLFFGIGEASKLATRPKGVPSAAYRRVGILGAGMMGAGIACAAAEAGLDVVLLDTTAELAARGKAYGEARWAKQAEQGRLSAEKLAALTARVRPTADFAALDGCDIVVEAVFEDRALKADVTRKAEAQLAPDAIFASNTSTLPISGLAQASARPANFIGLHFFSPAEKMPWSR